VTPPNPENALVVFAQRTDARVDIDGWNAHAMRFFATRIGLTTDRRYATGEDPPRTDALSFVVAVDGEAPGVRSVFVRPCELGDYALAEAIETKGRYTGLSLLARRCKMVWLIVHEGPADRTALRLAAIIASVLLGPILDAAGEELFGVKTARAKFEALEQR
jgi:hypothetical protein